MAKNEFQLLVRLLDNKTLTLHFPIHQPAITGESIKHQIQSLTKIPSQFQKLTLNGKFISDGTEIHEAGSLSTINLTFSLAGGKGGFGSLLRGAATKAGQKKTNNFDACRDMSGRRLRHVNAEKKLEEWRAEEGDRKLEKMADEYLKKMAKTAKKEGRRGNGNAAAERYVEKYREDSERCVKDVERSVRESAAELMVSKKRKLLEVLGKKDAKKGGDTKKMKIHKGKRTMGESDSDDSDDEDENNQDDSDKGCIVSSNSEDEETVTRARSSSSSSFGPCSSTPKLFPDDCGVTEPKSDGVTQKVDHDVDADSGGCVTSEPSAVLTTEGKCVDADSGGCITSEPSSVLNAEGKSGSSDVEEAVAASGVSDMKLDADVEKLNKESSTQPPLNFGDYSSAVELEALGLERLKVELQSRGLKCGGTLQERAARLFLLKTTPIEKLPKKLLAKK